MSLTSYRAAPPRANLRPSEEGNNVNGFLRLYPQASKPGDDLLFHRLGDSTIGAVRFHGRVRDGIGWVTDAMATKLWGPRMKHSRNRATIWLSHPGDVLSSHPPVRKPGRCSSKTVVDGGTLKRE